jgi:hypothetical protein
MYFIICNRPCERVTLSTFCCSGSRWGIQRANGIWTRGELIIGDLSFLEWKEPCWYIETKIVGSLPGNIEQHCKYRFDNACLIFHRLQYAPTLRETKPPIFAWVWNTAHSVYNPS